MASSAVLPTDWLRKVVVVWEGTIASPQEVLALKHVAPSYDAIGLGEIRAYVGNSTRFELGVFTKAFAEGELAKRAAKHGLRLELSNVTETEAMNWLSQQ